MTGDDTPLVVRFAALGDTVLLTVLLDGLAQRYGRPVDVLTSGGWAEPLLASQPYVRSLRTISSRKRPYWLTPSQWQAVGWIREHTGPIWLCDPDPAARRLLARAVPGERVRAVWDEWPGEAVHWADWWYALTHDRPIEVGKGYPRLTLPASWQQDAMDWLQAKGVNPTAPVLLLQPGSKKTHKRFSLHRENNDKFWPIERWVSLLKDLTQTDARLVVLLCGSEREADITGEIRAGALSRAADPARIIDAARELPLPRLAGLASLASGMISIDTGPAHLAAAFDCPMIVLFGKHGYQRWAPRAQRAQVICLGQPHYREEGHVEQIELDEVQRAWERLDKRPPRILA